MASLPRITREQVDDAVRKTLDGNEDALNDEEFRLAKDNPELTRLILELLDRLVISPLPRAEIINRAATVIYAAMSAGQSEDPTTR